jgi:ribonuclease P protein component
MLVREKRISRGYEFRNIYQQGKKVTGKYIIAFVNSNSAELSRFGIVTSKKVGKAVTRNKAKRRLRAIIQQETVNLKAGFDVVIVVRKYFPDASFELIKKDFLKVMGKAGLC